MKLDADKLSESIRGSRWEDARPFVMSYLQGLSARLHAMSDRVDALLGSARDSLKGEIVKVARADDERHADHERRIRDLERAVWTMAVKVGIGATVGGAALAYAIKAVLA